MLMANPFTTAIIEARRNLILTALDHMDRYLSSF
jgi:hypothetical protein